MLVSKSLGVSVSSYLWWKEGDDRGWDGWMASPTQWTWVWVNSWSWWGTGRPGVLQSMGRKELDTTEQLTELNCGGKNISFGFLKERINRYMKSYLHFIVHASFLPQRRQWHPTPVLLPGKSLGRRSLVGCSPWGRWESDTTERLHFHFSLSCIGEGNGNHSSVLAWRIPGPGEPGGLLSMESHRVGYDWSDLAAAAASYPYQVQRY